MHLFICGSEKRKNRKRHIAELPQLISSVQLIVLEQLLLLCAVIFVIMMIIETPVSVVIVLSNCAASCNCKGQYALAV